MLGTKRLDESPNGSELSGGGTGEKRLDSVISVQPVSFPRFSVQRSKLISLIADEEQEEEDEGEGAGGEILDGPEL